MNPWRWGVWSRAFNWLLSQLRFGAGPIPTWRPYHQVGSSRCPTAFLVVGGLSANGAESNRQLSRTLHRAWSEAHTWSRNLSGHTGRFIDFSGSRFWHWIGDAVSTLRKLTFRHKKQDIVLIGHSTGGLVVLAVALLFRLWPRWFVPPDQTVRIRAVLIFPPFRLKRKRDARLLGLVAILYYVISPAAFILLALSGPWMWPLSLLAFLCHILFVPQIWVPNGDERASAAAAPVARKSGERRRWIEMPEGLVLALACIYFVAAPPLIALGGKLMPGVWINGVFALFIATLLIPLFLIPREFESKPAIGGGRSSGYRWLPVITAANMLLLQQLLRPFLGWIRCPLLVLEGELDHVVRIDPSWLRAFGSTELTTELLPGFPHSSLSRSQQEALAHRIVEWCQSGSAAPVVECRFDRPDDAVSCELPTSGGEQPG
jgi:pimeloyl-ACP methyl ester carboxylesterase